MHLFQIVGKPATDEDVQNIFAFIETNDFFLNAINVNLLSRFPFLLHGPVYRTQVANCKRALEGIFEVFYYKPKVNRMTISQMHEAPFSQSMTQLYLVLSNN